MRDSLIIITTLDNHSFSGWYRIQKNQKIDFMVLNGSDNKIASKISLHPRDDMKALEGEVIQGFKVELGLNELVSASRLVDGDINLLCNVDNKPHPVQIYQRIHDSKLLSGLGKDRVLEAIKLVPEILLPFRNESLDNYWIPRAISLNTVAVITYANDSGAWFSYWLKHYQEQLPNSQIYVVTPKPENFKNFEGINVLGIVGSDYDDKARSLCISRLQQALLAYFQWIIVIDVDEILFSPRAELLSTYLQKCESDVVFSRGFDVIQVDGEKNFDFSKSITSQRSLGVWKSSISKPHLSKVPLIYSVGYHFCNIKPVFTENSLICLHLKWACKKVRLEVAKIVDKTKYADMTIEQYSKSSVDNDVAPEKFKKLMQLNSVKLNSEFIKEAETNYINSASLNSSNGLWIGKQHSAERLVDLKTMQRE